MCLDLGLWYLSYLTYNNIDYFDDLEENKNWFLWTPWPRRYWRVWIKRSKDTTNVRVILWLREQTTFYAGVVWLFFNTLFNSEFFLKVLKKELKVCRIHYLQIKGIDNLEWNRQNRWMKQCIISLTSVVNFSKRPYRVQL